MGLENRRLRLLDASPPELLVYDELGPCPYLLGQRARLPMRLPVRPLTETEFDTRLEAGDRRQGLLLYRPRCPSCASCEPIRIEIDKFRGSRTQRRILRRGSTRIEVELGAPELTDEKVALYNRHKQGRALLGDGDPIDAGGYGAFLVDTCADSFEMRYRLDGVLIGLAIVDQSSRALSAVYTYFDPDHAALSPGVFSIMRQVELCRERGLAYLYLGLYVEGCDAMAYKASYRPHQRLVGGAWITVNERAP